jgi:hypothetical protein
VSCVTNIELSAVFYKINDIVKYGGQLYICNTGHISDSSAIGGFESNLGDDSTAAFWDLYGEGFDYKADWSINTRYKVNDIVKYGSRVYICTGYHVSSPNTTSGLELNQSKWDIISDGFDWKTDWAVGIRYRVGDLVKYGGQVYSCNTGHTSAATALLDLLQVQVMLLPPKCVLCYKNKLVHRT